MNPECFMQGNVNTFTLSYYLGMDNRELPETKAHQNKQGLIFLEHFGILPKRDTPANCPLCGLRLQTGLDTSRHGWRYICKNHETRKKISHFDNTILTNVRIPADKIVLLIHMWVLRQPLLQVQTELLLSSDTAVSWYDFCRDVACAIAWHDFERIGTAGDVVEIDQMGLLKNKKNTYVSKKWHNVSVIGGVSRTTKKRFGVCIESRDPETVIPILQQCVDEDAYVCTDDWEGYDDCNLIFNDHGKLNGKHLINPPRVMEPIWMPLGKFKKECLDQNWKQSPPTPEVEPFRIHVQTVTAAWKELRSYITSSYHLEHAIGEWMYRKNILGEIKTGKGKFERFLRDIARVHPGVGKVPMEVQYEYILDCRCHECMPSKGL